MNQKYPNTESPKEKFTDTLFPNSPQNGIEYKRLSEMGKNFIFGDLNIPLKKTSYIQSSFFHSLVFFFSNYPNIIQRMFSVNKFNPIGLYEVNLFINGKWEIVIIDDYFPIKKETNEFMFFQPGSSNEIWMLLLEKAFAKSQGKYELSIFNQNINDILRILTGTNCLEYELFVQEMNSIRLKDLIQNNITNNGVLFLQSSTSENNLIFNELYQIIDYLNFPDKTQTFIKLLSTQKDKLYVEEVEELTNEEKKKVENNQIEGSFWIQTTNIISNFKYLFICPFELGLKTITFDYPAEVDTLYPKIYVFNVNEDSFDFSFTVFSSQEFLKNYSIHLIITQIDSSTNSIKKHFSSFSNHITLQYNTKLPKGEYRIWLYFLLYDYHPPKNLSTEKKSMSTYFQIKSKSEYYINYIKDDENFEYIKQLLNSTILNSKEKEINNENTKEPLICITDKDSINGVYIFLVKNNTKNQFIVGRAKHKMNIREIFNVLFNPSVYFHMTPNQNQIYYAFQKKEKLTEPATLTLDINESFEIVESDKDIIQKFLCFDSQTKKLKENLSSNKYTFSTKKKECDSLLKNITKYFKNQEPPNISLLKKEKKKFKDPFFPPQDTSILSLDPVTRAYIDNATIETSNNFQKTCSNYPDQWKRISEIEKKPSLFGSEISLTQISQGNIGDCYFISSIGAIVANHPGLIRKIFKTKEYNPEGVYEIYLFIDGEWQIVIVDDYLPFDSKISEVSFAKNICNSFWVCLLEKAWAKVNGGYTNIIKGQMTDAVSVLTGIPCEYIKHEEKENRKEEKYDKIDLITKLKNAVQEKAMVGCSCKESVNEERDNLVGNHVYSFIKIRNINNNYYLLLRNPWGRNKYLGNFNSKKERELQDFNKNHMKEGSFYIKMEDYLSYFDSTQICNIIVNATVEEYLLKGKEYTYYPSVFNFELKEKGKVAFCVKFLKQRFNRKIQNFNVPFCLVLCKFDKGKKVEKIYNKSSFNEDIMIYENLEKGSYLIWIYSSYPEETKSEDFTYLFDVSSSVPYSIKYNSTDPDFSLIHQIGKDYLIRNNIHQKEIFVSSSIIKGFFLYGVANLDANKIELITKLKITTQENIKLLPPFSNNAINKCLVPNQVACFLGFERKLPANLNFSYSGLTYESMYNKIIGNAEVMNQSKISEMKKSFIEDSFPKYLLKRELMKPSIQKEQTLMNKITDKFKEKKENIEENCNQKDETLDSIKKSYEETNNPKQDTKDESNKKIIKAPKNTKKKKPACQCCVFF